jgi:thioesterase domain-containing protein
MYFSGQAVVNANDLRRAENFLHEKIPLTRAMGIRVIPREQSFALVAPVALNHNHLGTAFGGSISAVATMAGYVFLWLRMANDMHVVIRESRMRFVRPVRGTICARCEEPSPEHLRTFDSELREKGKAQLRLRVFVEEADAIAAEFEGTFVAALSSRLRDE